MDHDQGITMLHDRMGAANGRATATVRPISQTDLNRSTAAILERLQSRPAPHDAHVREYRRRHEIKVKSLAPLADQLGPRYSLARSRLEEYQVYHVDQEKILQRLRQLDLAALIHQGQGLVFFGAVGTGKDHLMAAMLYQAAEQGHSCRWVNGQETYGQFRDRMSTGEKEEDLIRRLVEPQVLAISDPLPPLGDPTGWNLQQLYRLLDRRYRKMRSTWMALNAVDLDDADAKLSSAVFDRLQDNAEMLPCFWPSWRQRSQERRRHA